MAKLTRAQQKERDDAIAYLRTKLRPGDIVSTVLRHVSSSGMSRSISLMIVDEGEVVGIDYWAARAMNDRIDDKHGGIKIGGCGMDMGFALVYNLSRTLFPDGFGIVGDKQGSKQRPAKEADAVNMVKAGWVFRGRNGDDTGWDNDGGYALNQRWL